MRASVPAVRDARIDLVRGLALLTIFVDHIPDNALSSLTIGAFGLSDAAEVFVFAAGFSAFLAYGRVFERHGLRAGLVAVGRRCWRLFTAHVMLVVSLAALVAVASTLVTDADYIDRFNFSPLFVETDVAVPRLATLSYMPNTMDILPLYIVLIGMFPLIWHVVRLHPVLALAGSLGLWYASRHFGLNLPDYPERHWFFNPFVWQLVFTLGMVSAAGWAPMRAVARSNLGFVASLAFVALSLVAAAPWTVLAGLEKARLIPIEAYWGLIDKQSVPLWRVLHFASLAIIFQRLVPAEGRWRDNPLARLVVLCGQHGLKVFCIGCLLTFAAYVAIGLFGGTLAAQVAVSAVGVMLLLAVGPVTVALRAWDSPAKARLAQPG
jgi:hypothetical protein